MTRIRSDRASWNRGFTLTEVVVALAVAGVVASVAVPRSGELLDRYRLSSAVSQYKMEVARARMQAIGQNRYVRIKSKSTGFVREVSSDGVTFTQEGSLVSMPTGVEILFGYWDGPTFNRQGIATTVSYVQIRNSAGFRIVTISVLGKAEVS